MNTKTLKPRMSSLSVGSGSVPVPVIAHTNQFICLFRKHKGNWNEWKHPGARASRPHRT